MEASGWRLKKMGTKMMYLLDRLEGPWAGTEGQLLQLIENIDRTRFEPEITVLRSTSYVERNALPCPVQVLGIESLVRTRSVIALFRYAAKLRQDGVRLVHCYLNDVSIVAPPILKLFGLRVIVSRRDMGFWYTKFNLLCLRLSGRFVDRCIANAQAVKNVVHEREWLPLTRISVIYNGYKPRVDIADESAQGQPLLREIPKQARVVGIVANLKPIKRIDDLVRAFASVSKSLPDAFLVVIGADDRPPGVMTTRDRLEQLCASLGVTDRVLFTGRLQDPSPFVRQFSVGVICSESEGLSNSIIEYMQVGRPVVCTDTGGNSELVRDGHNGFLAPVGDVESLADRIGRVLSDPLLARRMGEASLAIVRSTYSHMQMVRQHMTCYDEVLSGCGPRVRVGSESQRS